MMEKESSEIKSDLENKVVDDNDTNETVRTEMQEFSMQGSPPTAMAMPPKPKDPHMSQVASRSDSMTNLQSASSTAPPRTLTSQRGGRQRNRSPPLVMSRLGSASAFDRDYHDDIRNQSQSPANPSSAAAAAAAAAKALSNSSSNGNPQWFDGGESGSSRRERRIKPSHFPPQYDDRYGGSRHWPTEDDPESRVGYGPVSHRDAEPDMRGYMGRGAYGYDRNGAEGRSESFNTTGRHTYDRRGGTYGNVMHGDMRYQDGSNKSFERERQRPLLRESDRHHLRYNREPGQTDDLFRGSGVMLPGGEMMNRQGAYSPKEISNGMESPMTVKRTGGTTRVIGTAKPIHLPRPVDIPMSSGHHKLSQGGRGPVFRDRPGSDNENQKSRLEDENHQKMLMSLHTPSTSFEEQQDQSKSRKLTGGPEGLPLSPVEPPQLHHSHHQQQIDQNLFQFEQQARTGSPKLHAQGQLSGLEMASSFPLFNQSFDSLGDAAPFLSSHLEGTFNSNSFAFGPTNSRDNIDETQLLQNPSQTGSYAANDRILSSSSGVNFTFGMSPINSYDAPIPSSRGSCNTMLLGGSDQQNSSPTQMLNIYPSYSGGYGSQTSGQATSFRNRSDQNENGSFGGGPPMYSQSYESSPRGVFGTSPDREEAASSEGSPGFYSFLTRNKSAFAKCTFLLPGLKAALLESPLIKLENPNGLNAAVQEVSLGSRRSEYTESSPLDSAIAMRRVVSAICAFGGTISGDRGIAAMEKRGESQQSIFREKDDGIKTEPAPVTPPLATGTLPGARGEQSISNRKYDELLPTRYYENDNRLSWEFEESPPVGLQYDLEPEIKDKANIKSENSETTSRLDSSPTPSEDDQKQSSASVNDDGSKSGGPEGDQPKMRYRCKLCGLPKQNHTCAYQQSLQRSIGIMVYPAVNAFTSGEPGLLAPTLTDMNNFVMTQPGDSSSYTEESPSRPTPDRSMRAGIPSTTNMMLAPNVTPETMRSSNSSSSSGQSGGHGTPIRTPGSTSRKPRGSNLSGGAAMGQRVGAGSPPGSQSRKRTHSQLCGGDEDLLFVDVVDLKPEQFRIITPTRKVPQDSYTYPPLPLPYAQRKRLSDNLFALSKEVPELTDECAVVLREARERDMWDLAVAELMTQVVVIIHCNGDDSRFEGLRHYLLTLGIAC